MSTNKGFCRKYLLQNKSFIFTVFLLTLIFLSSIFPAFSGLQAADIKLPEVEYKSYKLDNGLELLVFSDHSIPSLRFSIYYNVGSIDENAGETGISHFLEHIMFLGTKNLAEGKLDDLISSVGGQLNAATSFDYTYYYYQLPSSKLELAMALESDRMHNLKFKPAEINREREVIKQERRMRTENDVFALGFEKIKAAAFADSYLEHNVIGWRKDINQISASELKNYYQQYYAPNNALIVVSGDVDFEQAKKLFKKYYADYQPAEIPRKDFKLKTQTAEKTKKVYLDTDLSYALQFYQVPPANSRETAALEIFLQIFAAKENSRLSENLQKKEGLIIDSGGFIYPLRTDSFALIYFIPAAQNLLEKAQLEFDRQLEEIFTAGISQQEFENVKTQYQKSLIFSQKDINSAASTAALNKLRFDEANLIQHKINYINQLSREDIIKAAKKYLQSSRRTKGYILPQKEGELK